MAVPLAACNIQEDGVPPLTTGQESSFELTGDVAAVDIEDVDFGLSIPPEGVNVGVEAGITVSLTINIESIDDATAQLCGLQAGSDAILVVDDNSDLDFDRPLTELGTLEDESIRATGIAKERAALQSPGGGSTEPAGKCELRAQTVALVEQATPEPNASPTPGL
jgi:hypothetical protein